MKTDIDYAALGGGVPLRTIATHTGPRTEYRSQGREWNPLHDDGDSRRLEIACLNWIGRVMECPKSVIEEYSEFIDFVRTSIDIRPEQYRAAVFALAVAIGKMIDGGGV